MKRAVKKTKSKLRVKEPKTIPVLYWDDGAEEPYVWRLDDPEEGARFFGFLQSTSEFDGRDKMWLKNLSTHEWKRIIRESEKMA